MAFQVGMEGPSGFETQHRQLCGDGTDLLPVEWSFRHPHSSLRAQVLKHSLSVPSFCLLVALDVAKCPPGALYP